MVLEQGRRVGRYLIQERTGHGLYPTWRVRRDGQSYALRVLPTRHEPVLKRLLREAEALARIRHDNLVRVIEVVEVDGQPGIVMDHPGCPDLAGCLDLAGRLSQRRLSGEEIDALARGMLMGIAEAHRLGMVHRDLQPSNVFILESEGRCVPVLSGFGVARALAEDPALSATAEARRYLAPEQLPDPRKGDERSDLFSLGLVLYEMITGVPPGSAMPALREVAPREVPERMLQAIDLALQADPALRVGTCEGMHAIWRGVSGPTLAPAMGSVDWIEMDRAPTQRLQFASGELAQAARQAASAWAPEPSPWAPVPPEAPEREEVERSPEPAVRSAPSVADAETVKPVQRTAEPGPRSSRAPEPEPEPPVALAFAAGVVLAAGTLLLLVTALLTALWVWAS